MGHYRIQFLKVCPVRHMDEIKFDLGSYSWHFYPYFYKARLSTDPALPASFLLVVLDQNFWILAQHFLTQKKKKKVPFGIDSYNADSEFAGNWKLESVLCGFCEQLWCEEQHT